MAGSVIQATGMVEFEDGLRTGFPMVSLWRLHLGSIPPPPLGVLPPLGVWVGPEGNVVVMSSQTKFLLCRVPRISGIKLQLLRIDLAVGSIPYPRSGM